MAGDRVWLRPSRVLPLPAAVLAAAAGFAQPAPGGAHPAFSASETCVACHGDVVDDAGHAVSIARDWRATMMALSARDPYWQAGVRRELTDRPHLRAEIEDTCSVCHMPMARTTAVASGRTGEIFAHLEGTAADPVETRHAWDGVSCTLCHQIRPEGLGEDSSFGGGYRIDVSGSRIFGPFEVDGGRQRIMHSATGYLPEQASHLGQSELCATCHTLFTRALDGDGEEIGEFPEQVPYLEWRHSGYAEVRGCQDCHMPTITAPISAVLGEVREGVSRHAFRGGNVFMLRMLDRYRDELNVSVPSEELERSAAATLEQLQQDTARVEIESAERAAGELLVEVRVRNLAGHKLPTAYPSRRAWIHLRVAGAGGAAVFESGRPLPDGSIEGNDNDRDARAYEPHYEEIASGEQVQIYETIVFDHAGEITTSLLSAVRYAKDNRLPPEGFDKATAGEAVAVHGAAAGDPDFGAGGDAVRYRVSLGDADGPLTVSARLLFQTIGYRWAHNLEAYDSFEPQRFLRYYQADASGSAVVLAKAERQIR